MKLIIGLGNPGKKYEKTRHNIGFVVVDEVISNFQFSIFKQFPKFKSQISKGNIKDKKIIFAKPQTFMNNSGEGVRALIDFYKIDPENDLIIIHDDKDIPLGTIKIQKDKSAAGHNGIKSIIQHLGTQNFTRVRIGVAPEDPRKIGNTADFVLKKFGFFEKKKINLGIDKAVEGVINLLTPPNPPQGGSLNT